MDIEALRAAYATIGIELSDDEIALASGAVTAHLEAYSRIRDMTLDSDVAPAHRFDPRLGGVVGRAARTLEGVPALASSPRPDDPREIHYASVSTLAGLIRRRELSCVELATIALQRLRSIDPVLRCVVNFLDERALAQARARDRELQEGIWRGPLHGIPWGAKDLLAVAGAPTTWGSPPFADQMFERDATVVHRLDEAGAILVAKLALGELAAGDRWQGGQTRDPWDPSEGSGGSSSGPAAAVAAGAVPFAIGSETIGSIMNPSRQCGCSSLRPTFGRVSRYGAMTLAWSMDKLGPMARSAEDAAMAFGAIVGPDGQDDTVVDLPFVFPAAVDPPGWRIGVVTKAFERVPQVPPVTPQLREMGATVVPIDLPESIFPDWEIALFAEAAASFDEFTRTGQVHRMFRQDEDAWPTRFRAARLIPAVEWLRLDRLRRALILDVDRRLRAADVDVVVHPTGDPTLRVLENLTGHPGIALPWGRRPNGAPESLTFVGHLDGETDLLAFAIAWQARTDDHLRHPAL